MSGLPSTGLSRIEPAAATWRSGYAADCKSVYAGSIPAVASSLTGAVVASPVRPTTRVLTREENDDG